MHSYTYVYICMYIAIMANKIYIHLVDQKVRLRSKAVRVKKVQIFKDHHKYNLALKIWHN